MPPATPELHVAATSCDVTLCFFVFKTKSQINETIHVPPLSVPNLSEQNTFGGITALSVEENLEAAASVQLLFIV